MLRNRGGHHNTTGTATRAAHRSHRIQKHNFGVTCPDTLFMETAPDPPEHEKYCIDLSCPECTGMLYVTHRSHQIQKHKFGITCPGGAFYGNRTGPTQLSKMVCRHLTPRTHRNALRDPQILPDAKTQVQHNVSWCAFYGNRTGRSRP
jgi:hypothetical protein